MRRVLPWIVAFALAFGFGGGAIVALNATVFGPGDFVRVYLDAIARGDAEGALSLPGVTAAGADDLLLEDDVLIGLTAARQVSDEALGEGKHRITVEWTAPSGSGTTSFDVERVGTRLGLFPEWGFIRSPVARLELDVQHDPRFTVNGVDETTGQTVAGAVPYAVFVPGTYVFGHDTVLLHASDVTVLADTVGTRLDTTLDVEAGPAFPAALATEVRRHLTDCTLQQVLFPTACPFGKTITNRVDSDPVWTMVAFPELDIEPGTEFGTWQAGPASGTAHLVVEVKSLFDGTVSTLDEDVIFEVSYLGRIDGDTLTITEAELP